MKYTVEKINIEKNQRGPTVKLMFSVERQNSDRGEIITEFIRVGNLALAVMMFEGIDYDLRIGMKIKRSTEANIIRFPITIVCEEFAEQFVCSDEWMETQIKVIPPDSFISGTDRAVRNAMKIVYSFEVDVQVTVSTDRGVPGSLPSKIMKQLFNNAEFTDCQLLAKDGSVLVHKVVLSFQSDMFKTILQLEGTTASEESSIYMKAFTVQTLQHLKAYMYLGKLPDEGLESLLLIASCYSMDSLKTRCIIKLVQTIKPEDLNPLVEFACKNNMPDLIKEILFKTPARTVSRAYQLDIDYKINTN